MDQTRTFKPVPDPTTVIEFGMPNLAQYAGIPLYRADGLHLVFMLNGRAGWCIRDRSRPCKVTGVPRCIPGHEDLTGLDLAVTLNRWTVCRDPEP